MHTAKQIQEHRTNSLKLFHDLRAKFIGTHFQLHELTQHYGYTMETAPALVTVLAEAGFLSMRDMSGVMVYYFHTDLQEQIDNIEHYRKACLTRLNMYRGLQKCIEEEIEQNKKGNNLKVV